MKAFIEYKGFRKAYILFSERLYMVQHLEIRNFESRL
jgi:hypothetical protein